MEQRRSYLHEGGVHRLLRLRAGDIEWRAASHPADAEERWLAANGVSYTKAAFVARYYDVTLDEAKWRDAPGVRNGPADEQGRWLAIGGAASTKAAFITRHGDAARARSGGAKPHLARETWAPVSAPGRWTARAGGSSPPAHGSSRGGRGAAGPALLPRPQWCDPSAVQECGEYGGGKRRFAPDGAAHTKAGIARVFGGALFGAAVCHMAAPPAPGRSPLNHGGQLAFAMAELAVACGRGAAVRVQPELALRIVELTGHCGGPAAAESRLAALALSRPLPPPQQTQGIELPPQPAGVTRPIFDPGPLGVEVHGTGNGLVVTH